MCPLFSGTWEQVWLDAASDMCRNFRTRAYLPELLSTADLHNAMVSHTNYTDTDDCHNCVL